MIKPKSLEYPPGCNRRVIDWVRSPLSTVRICDFHNCKDAGEIRETPEGSFCLRCYMEFTECSEIGCHKPALNSIDKWSRTSKDQLGTCRFHHYLDEDEVLGKQRESLERGQSPFAGYVYSG